MDEKKDEGCSGCGQSTGVIVDATGIKQKAPCKGCSQHRFSGKLGTCIDCILANSIGAFVGWLGFLIFFLLQCDRRLYIGALLLASSFSLLLLAHGIAYLVKRGRRNS
jgi:hypothetical protein